MSKRTVLSGIYRIRCSANDRIYIGSSIDIEVRWRKHVYDLKRGRHGSPHLQHAWNKYGNAAFEMTVVEECAPDRATLLAREQHYIDTSKPEFNYCPTAGSRLGSRTSEETKARLREVWKAKQALITHCPAGHPYDDKNTHRKKNGERICRECARLRVAATIAAETPEQRESRIRKQRVRYESVTREKLGIAKHGSPEHSAKLTAMNKARVYGEEARRNMSIAAKKAATTERMQKAWDGHRRHLDTVGHHQKGKPLSAETRQKIRETLVAKITHCKHGHPFDEANTLIDGRTGKRICRACRRAIKAKIRAAETPEQKAHRLELKRQSWQRHAEANRERQNLRYREKVAAKISALAG